MGAAALRAYGNAAAFLAAADRYSEANTLTDAALELAQRVGDRGFDIWFLAGKVNFMVHGGLWDEALALVDEMRRSGDPTGVFYSLLLIVVQVFTSQGRPEAGREMLASQSIPEHTEELQHRAFLAWARAVLLRDAGDYEGALHAPARGGGVQAGARRPRAQVRTRRAG